MGNSLHKHYFAVRRLDINSKSIRKTERQTLHFSQGCSPDSYTTLITQLRAKVEEAFWVQTFSCGLPREAENWGPDPFQ